ncbi:hypothetical protein ADT28_09255 [Xylella fastidiosa]|nr:hypothetical protein XFFB_06755 [Xylella fastidiosa]KXB11335.1 hypothetical protein ADT29_12245 [Xylella fastidiosa]KXB19822.1 hypothetical protein ADT28_09255 [Xylella fastidiosa]
MAGVADAQAVFGANQGDFAGIHAAQGGDVQGHGGAVAWGCRQGGGGVSVQGDGGRAGGGLKFLGPEAGVELDGAGNQGGVVGAAAVQAQAVELNGAAVDAVVV